MAAYMIFASTVDFRLILDFFDSGLYTCTAVARLTLALAKLSCLKSCYVKLCKRLHLANYDNYFTVTNSKYWVCWSSVASLLLKTWKLYTFFNFASIAATENRLLSYKKPQSFHRHVTVVFRPTHWKCITGVKNLEGVVGFWPQWKGSYFWCSGLWCKVSSKWSEICDCRRGDRQTDRSQTDTGDFIICPMLCYSNGTDNYLSSFISSNNNYQKISNNLF